MNFIDGQSWCYSGWTLSNNKIPIKSPGIGSTCISIISNWHTSFWAEDIDFNGSCKDFLKTLDCYWSEHYNNKKCSRKNRYNDRLSTNFQLNISYDYVTLFSCTHKRFQENNFIFQCFRAVFLGYILFGCNLTQGSKKLIK